MNGFAVVIALAAVGLFAWLLTAGVWWLVRRLGHVTGLDEKVDQFMDVGEGGLDSMDYLELREQRPHGGGG
jgi:hypothetical protein